MKYDISNPDKFFEDHKKGLLNISFRADIIEYFGYNRNPNGSTRRKVYDLFDDIDEFVKGCLEITKTCPCCGKEFTKFRRDESVTCSHSCSNNFFAEKRMRPDYTLSYRTICFRYHKKACVVCGEDKIVEVHHYDENHSNNEPSNLVPLCPNHHRYWHSRYKYLVKGVVDDYVRDFTSH